MKKLKLFLALAGFIVGGGNLWAQTDVTSTYITNPSFESDGAITASNGALTITGWTQSDPASLYNNTGCYNASTAIPTQGTVMVTPSAGDYYLYFRKGWAQAAYTFTSATSQSELPAGYYSLSVDYKMVEGYDNTQNNNTTLSIAAKNGDTVLGTATGTTKTNVSGGNDYTYLNTADWSTVTADFTLEEAKSINVVITCNAGGQRRSDFVIDNVKLLYTAFVSPTALSLSSSELALTTGATSTLTATITPSDANYQTDITWTTSAAAVATVANGVVKAVGPGTATITATTANNVSTTCEVTVTNAAAPSFYSEIAAGDFYIVNAATGKAIGTIKNGWGTQAGLADHGIPFTVALGDGVYTLDSHTYNRAAEHYFNGTFVDGASTNLYINSLGSGKYSISTADGSAFVTANVNDNVVANTASDANSVLAQWYFVSKANLESALASATTANPVDATFYIQDPDFSRNHIIGLLQNGETTVNLGSETYLWKYTTSNYHFKGGANGNMCAETYQNGGGKIYQELTGIKNGKYLLKAQAFHNGSGVTSLYANDESIEVAVLNANGEGTAASMSGASAAFSAGQYQNELEVFVTDGNLTIGIENVSTNWACFDNFELYYLGPTVGGEATEIAMATETAMTAGSWYYFDIPVDGMYNLTTTTLSDIVYTTNGTVLIENESSVTDNFTTGENATLTAGRYYVKSASAQNLEVTVGAYAYNVGDATLSVADGGYTQNSTFTVTFPAAATSDPAGATALVASSTATVNGNSVALTAVENGFSLDLGTLTENTDYVIAIPVGVYGYAGESLNKAINVTLHTPTVFDGEYVLYDATNKLFLGRGAAYGTQATTDKYGIPFALATDATGVSSFKFVDNDQYLFSNNIGKAAGMYTDNASTGWNIIVATDGYILKDVNGDVYAKVDNGSFGYYAHTVEGSENATVWTFKTLAERDAIIAAYPTDNINNVITVSGVSTTADAFATYLSNNYNAIDYTSSVGTATFAGAVGDWTWEGYWRNQDGQPAYGTGFVEAWNATGAWSQTIDKANLPAGIYKVTVQGYERRKANDAATALKTAGYNLVSTFLSANGEQVRFTDWNDVAGKPTNTTGAVTAFTNGEAVNEVYVYLDGNTDLTLMVRKPNYIWDCWIIWNNVKLTRYEDKAVTLDETVAWTPAASPSANVTLTRSFNSNWATFVVPFDIDNETLKAQFGDDVEVSTIASTAEGLKFTAMETPAVTAGEPVILKTSEAKSEFTFENVEVKAVETTKDLGNGVSVVSNYGGKVVIPASAETAYYYIASNKLKKSTGSQNISGFRAYFAVAADSPVKGFFENGFDFGGADAINGINADVENGTVYNLAGQRVNKAQKGIYIVNGKKVLVK